MNIWAAPPRKILGTIFKVSERRTSTNGQEEKKTDDDAYGITFQQWYWQTLSIKKGGWEINNVQVNVSASIQRLEDYLKSAEEHW